MAIGIVNRELGLAGCDDVSAAIRLLEVLRSEASGAFNPLTQTNPDLGSKFISELNNSLDDIYKFLKDNIHPAAQEYFKEDNNENPDPTPKEENPKGNDPGGVVPPITENPIEETPAEETPAEETPAEETPSEEGTEIDEKPPIDEMPSDEQQEIPPQDEETGIVAAVLDEIDTSSLEEMSLGDVNGTVDELIDISKDENVMLDELLDDDEKSDMIKELLLKSPYLPDEFKEIITDLDSSCVRLLLDYILKGNEPEIFELNPLNLGMTYTYLMDIAKANEITLDELLYDPKYTDLLRVTLQDLDNVVSLIKGWEEIAPEDFQEQLKNFYNGNISEEFPNEDIIATRAFVDYLAKECDIPYDDLLYDKSYAETLKEGALEFGKSLTFFKASGFFTDEGMRENITRTFDGTNYKALGMDEESIESFKGEMDTLAKENNVSVDKLLTDSKYADVVKEKLKTSNAAPNVGDIYDEVDSEVSQNVAKNLYNTSFEKSEQQIELEELAKKAIETKKQSEWSIDTGNENIGTKLFEDNDYVYTVSDPEVVNYKIEYSNGDQFSIQDALEKGKVTIDDLIRQGLIIQQYEKKENVDKKSGEEE